jgi:hypothetical protein
MRRVLVYLADRQVAVLRGMALREGRPMAVILRRMIDAVMQRKEELG